MPNQEPAKETKQHPNDEMPDQLKAPSLGNEEDDKVRGAGHGQGLRTDQDTAGRNRGFQNPQESPGRNRDQQRGGNKSDRSSKGPE